MSDEPQIMHLQRNTDGTWFRMMAPSMGVPESMWWREESLDGVHFERVEEHRP